MLPNTAPHDSINFSSEVTKVHRISKSLPLNEMLLVFSISVLRQLTVQNMLVELHVAQD
jgi:hypothetical protein